MPSVKTTWVQKLFRVVLGGFMTVAGAAHLTVSREEFLAQVPRWLPDSPGFRDTIVVGSGVAELVLGLSMVFVSRFRVVVGLGLALFYVLIFPGNISQFTNSIDGFGLDTDRKRFVRLFFQPVLILWALWSTGALEYLKERFSDDAK
jgi:uncharacterized membrane protein